MVRDTKPKKTTSGRGVTVSDSRRKKTKRRDEENNNNNAKGNNVDHLAAESIKTRQVQSSKEGGEKIETCRLNSKTNRSFSARRKKTLTKNAQANSDKLDAETVKTRQIHLTCDEGEINNKPSGLDRNRPQSKLQLQRFEEFTRDAVTKGVKGVLEEYALHLKAHVPSEATRNAFDANPKKNRYAGNI
uniref:Uncharacterized protein n=1 Tax=Panagrolaimus sp. ES5 TaxID=591445 RepID=A0AC34G1F0_9BILA